MRPAFRCLMLIAAASVAFAGPAATQTELLYDVDFSTPPHVVGSLPATGTGQAPRDVPTEIRFGDPTVVNQLGTLTDQPCSFGNGTTGYDQLEFGVDPSHAGGFPNAFDEYHFEMMLLIEDYGTGELFKILFDCPTVNNIEFHGDGTIGIFPGGGTIGTFTFGVPFLLEVGLDFVAEQWTISLDGTDAHTGPLEGDRLRAFRMNLSGTHANSRVAIDELRLYGGPTVGLAFLYHVDFGAPPHAIGSPPVVGTGTPPRKTPTEIRFGDPTVVAALGALTAQPCAFGNGTTGYDQLKFHVDPDEPEGFDEAYDLYMLSLEVLVEEFITGDAFEIILDCPTVHKLVFMADETVEVFPGYQTIGQYSFGTPIDVRVMLDIPNGEWRIWLEGDPVYAGPATAEMLRSFRLHLTGLDATHAAAVDEVYLWGWGQTSGIGELEPAAIMGNVRIHPNPTPSGSWIHWTSPPASPVRAEIVTVTGRRIWSRTVAATAGGSAVVHWDGRDGRGRAQPAGVYFARVREGDRVLGRGIIVLRR